MVRLLFSFIFIWLPAEAKTSSVCLDWFSKLEIVSSSGCESYCSIAATDMSTFTCHSSCADLCKKNFKKNTSSVLHPILNNQEVALSKKNPFKSIKAYRLSHQAEEDCSALFYKSKTNDASDACRHFFWAYLLASQIDLDFAKKTLDAHESEPLQPSNEKAMDEKNNSLAFDYFKEKKDASAVELQNKFIDLIKNKSLKIINPDNSNWRKK